MLIGVKAIGKISKQEFQNMFVSKIKQAFAVGFLSITICVLGWQTNFAQAKNYEEEFHREIGNALAEINLPTTNNPAETNAVADNLANFIFYRSGVQLSQANKDLLRELEEKSWQQSKRINRGYLTRILSDIAIEKITKATDADINYIAKNLGGFDAPDLPESFKKGNKTLMLRASGAGYIEEEEFIEQAKVLRDTIKSNKIVQSFIVSAIEREIGDRINFLAKASPKYFGSSRSDLTPAQAVLVTYAIITDDFPAGNQKELQQKMEDLQKIFSRLNNQSYPSPHGHRAYGANGYLFSTPANLLLDDAAVAKILNGIKEKAKIQ